jgi:hypothetical protein
MKLQLVLVTVIALMMSACGKQNSSNSGSTRVNRYQSAQIVPGTTSCSATSWGRIYDNTTDEATFRQRVIDITFRDDIGTISPLYNSNTGIEFQMTLNFSGGQLSQARSTFKVSDSVTVNENGGYIQFVLGAIGGSGQSGYFNATLGDSKGTIRLEGQKNTYNGQQVYFGKAYYNNNNGDQVLGDFIIGACAVVGI